MEEVAVFLLMHLWIYPDIFQQVIAIIRGSWFPSEATQAVCIVDVYGLRPVQSGQLSSAVTRQQITLNGP
jgi:hypothetical protein